MRSAGVNRVDFAVCGTLFCFDFKAMGKNILDILKTVSKFAEVG